MTNTSKKSALCFIVVLLTASVTAQTKMEKNPRMTAEEKARVIGWLIESEKEYLSAIENLTPAQWSYKSSPFRWSVGEVAEHIALTEAALFASVERALASPANPDWETKTAGKAEFIERVMPSRTGRAQAPIEVRPSGKLTRDEVIRKFKEMRAKMQAFAEKTDLPLKAHTLDHPFRVFNTLSAYDWLIYIPLHTLRHNKQIAEVKSSAGYPR
ncbi:MAG: DinB family protein [Acidobacteriota bacterium]